MVGGTDCAGEAARRSDEVFWLVGGAVARQIERWAGSVRRQLVDQVQHSGNDAVAVQAMVVIHVG
jgi:hypothetical protein